MDTEKEKEFLKIIETKNKRIKNQSMMISSLQNKNKRLVERNEKLVTALSKIRKALK